MNAKQVVEEVFTRTIARDIWTANALAVLLPTLQGFSVGAILPAVFYMFRWGHRRGRGRFRTAFSPNDTKPNIFWISANLSQKADLFEGFSTEAEKDILGDLLLCYALENKAHAEGNQAEVQRVFPTHFFSAWIDLPYSVAHLRFVPEMLVALLADQPNDRFIQRSAHPTDFSVYRGFKENLLLNLFGKGVIPAGTFADERGDRVDENAALCIDELLMVRLAQACGEAPEKLRGAGEVPLIPNSSSVAKAASADLRNDLRILLLNYGSEIPRLALTPMLECLLGLGLLNLMLQSFSGVVRWDQTGRLLNAAEQKSWPVFVDCSGGTDPELRRLSEESFGNLSRLIDQAAVALMAIRIADAECRDDPDLHPLASTGPDASPCLNLLGEVRHGRHETSPLILRILARKCVTLATALQREGLHPEVVDALQSPAVRSDPIGILADSICVMMGEKLLRNHYFMFVDSCLMVDQPHGLGRKRRVTRQTAGDKRKAVDLRSIVLSNTLLEALVHRHLCCPEPTCPARALSFAQFLAILRDQYGLWVDEYPPGMSVSRDELLRNRQILERRLRDLGLLAGVNDAESMKRLRPRYRMKGIA